MKSNQKPKILNVRRTDEYVKIRVELAKSSETKVANDPANPGERREGVVTSSSEFEETAHEAPLDSFDKALQALAAVAAKILECVPSWKEGVTVVGFSLSYTKSGVRSMVVSLVKELDATSSLHPLKTPAFQIDNSKNPNEGRMQIADSHRDLCVKAIKEAQRYFDGERSQQLLNFERQDSDAKTDNVAELPGVGKGDGED